MNGIEIADREHAFWVLVKGTADGEDDLLDVEDVTIEEAGIFQRQRIVLFRVEQTECNTLSC